MLTDMLSRQTGDLQLTPRGAFSVSLQQEAIGSLSNGWFPQPTPVEPGSWHWVHCQVGRPKFGRRPLELVLPDLSGLTLSEEIERPQTHPMLCTLLRNCVSAVVLLDASRLAEGDREPDFFAMKCVSYLCELDGRKRGGWPTRPFAFVFTKADTIEACFDDPAAFTQRFAPGLARQTAQRLRHYAFFATAVAGGCACQRTSRGRFPFPMRIEPRGVIRPFEWLLRHLRA
jgi:hypothetical protein